MERGDVMAKRIALKMARLERGWTQEETAERLGLNSSKTYGHWETGQTKNPPVKGMVACEKLFGRPKEELFPDVFGEI